MAIYIVLSVGETGQTKHLRVGEFGVGEMGVGESGIPQLNYQDHGIR